MLQAIAQTESCPTFVRLRALSNSVKSFEHVWLMFRRDADSVSVISYPRAYLHLVRLRPLCFARGVVLDRIVKEVNENCRRRLHLPRW